MKLINFYKLKESGPPANWPWTSDQMTGTEEQAEHMLRAAIMHGKLIPAPRAVFGSSGDNDASTNMIWDIGDSFIGVNVYEGWPLVWTAPKMGMRAGLDLKNPNTKVSNVSYENEIDPWSSEMDDFATTVHWITPDAFSEITGEGD